MIINVFEYRILMVGIGLNIKDIEEHLEYISLI